MSNKLKVSSLASKTLPKQKKTKAKDVIPYHHGDLRNMVLRKSGEFLEEKGAFALSLRDVALALGVSHTAPYRHFPKKIDLLFALTTEGFLELASAMASAWQNHKDAVSKLESAGEAYVDLAWKYPRRTELMFSGEVYSESDLPEGLVHAGREAYLGLYRIVEFGQSNGEFRKNYETEAMAMAVWSSVHGFSVLNEREWKNAKSEGEKVKLKTLRSVMLNLVMEGVRA